MRFRRVLRFIAAVVLLLATSRPSFADTRNEFWPELDAYVKLNRRVRLFLMAAFTRAEEPEETSGGGIYRDAQLGAHLDLSLKPIFRRQLRESEWEQQRYLWLRIGYRYGTSIGSVASPYREHRGITELTARWPLPRDFSVANRVRIDFRSVDDRYSTRFRDRVALEREMVVRGVHVVPSISAEVYYDTRFGTVNRQRYRTGVELTLSEHWRIEPAFIRQEDQRSDPAHVNGFGLILKYYR